jgi:hypothetical protein
VVVALTGKDGQPKWTLPITGQVIAHGQVIALSVDDWKLAGGPIRFYVDAVGSIVDYRGTWIELYGYLVLKGGRLAPDRRKIEARLTSVKPETPPEDRTPVRPGGGHPSSGAPPPVRPA